MSTTTSIKITCPDCGLPYGGKACPYGCTTADVSLFTWPPRGTDLDDCAALAIMRDADDARTIALGMGCIDCGTPTNAFYREDARVFLCDSCESGVRSALVLPVREQREAA